MPISFNNFISYDPNAKEEEYMFGLSALGQDKSNEYVIIIGIVGIKNGIVSLTLKGESNSASIYNGIAIFRSETWPFDTENSIKITVSDSDTGSSHLYYRAIIQAATSDQFFQQQYLIIDKDFDGIEDI